MEETPNQFRRTETTTETTTTPAPASRLNRFLTPAILGLGLLLLVGGIVLSLRGNNEPEIVSLPDYSPSLNSPAGSPSGQTASPTATASPSAEPTPSESPSEAVAVASPAPATQTVQNSSKGGVALSTPKKQVAAKPQVKAATTTQQAAPAPSQPTSSLPEYQPSVAPLPQYQPQYVASPQTISVTLSVSGKNYTVAVAPGAKVVDVFKAATAQGLTYKVKSFSFGDQIIEINGIAQEEGKNYWLYTINGAFATQGINQQTVNQGDILTWTLSAAQ